MEWKCIKWRDLTMSELKTEIKAIESKDTYDFILKKHYAQRKPSISFSYGLFLNDKLEGVLTIGKPASNSLCEGVCGTEHKNKVYELNRLIVNDNLPKNYLSIFVSKVLRMLKSKDLIIVSYADEAMNHIGYIYQATNFIYTGKTKERTDKYVPNGKHSRHYTEDYSHIRKFRSSKHRYIYFTGKSKKYLLEKLKYDILPYPKGDNGKYILGEKLKTKCINIETGEVFYE
jgi:hypothetical protein